MSGPELTNQQVRELFAAMHRDRENAMAAHPGVDFETRLRIAGSGAIRAITDERFRAHEKHRANGKSAEQMAADDLYWLPVLIEEVAEAVEEIVGVPPWPDVAAIIEHLHRAGEAARALCDAPEKVDERLEFDHGRLRAELVQIGAMASAWVDAIGRAAQ